VNLFGSAGAPPCGLGDGPSVCPHCWMVNPGAFRLCSRCGAAMDTVLQESGGLARTAPVQSPVPVRGRDRLTAFQRAVVGLFVAVLALGYLVFLLPQPRMVPADATIPVSPGGMP
jgi:hypothetical protein